jgi:hypothetical protein
LKLTVLPQADALRVSFPWLLLQSALSIFNRSPFLLKNIFEKELVKINDFAMQEES